MTPADARAAYTMPMSEQLLLDAMFLIDPAFLEAVDDMDEHEASVKEWLRKTREFLQLDKMTGDA